MRTEPLRLPAAITSLILLVVLPSATALLQGDEWRTVLLVALAAVPVLLGGVEAARAFVDSPVTRAARDADVAERRSRRVVTR